ncbi:replication initiator protein [Peromfec virus RodF8_40]|uniref:Replication initiator protein n=1 Tax=Peromfec virus RodF8_40 TaxID=2929374 RepID=A0A976N270_9VIRU|nr:replication initiator protein [Peromfec virus RodF8_40]
MVCFSPIKAYRSRRMNKDTKKFPILFSPRRDTYSDVDGLVIPCGRCPGCLMAKSFEWTVRCVCESYSYSESYFFTFTYDKEHLPEGGTLVRAHFQSFMKRLRYYFPGYKIKVFYCGEYGEKRHRPHYHAILFGLPLQQEKIRFFQIGSTKRGNAEYYCPLIDKIWGLGSTDFGFCTPESCSYVAQYTLKKNKILSDIIKKGKDVEKPFIGSSRRNSIGFDYFMRYWRSIYNRGLFSPFPPKKGDKKPVQIRPIRYFNMLLEKHFPIQYIKYVVLPRRKAMYLERKRRVLHPDQFAEELDKKLRNRYYKERAILRRLSRDIRDIT